MPLQNITIQESEHVKPPFPIEGAQMLAALKNTLTYIWIRNAPVKDEAIPVLEELVDAPVLTHFSITENYEGARPQYPALEASKLYTRFEDLLYVNNDNFDYYLRVMEESLQNKKGILPFINFWKKHEKDRRNHLIASYPNVPFSEIKIYCTLEAQDMELLAELHRQHRLEGVQKLTLFLQDSEAVFEMLASFKLPIKELRASRMENALSALTTCIPHETLYVDSVVSRVKNEGQIHTQHIVFHSATGLACKSLLEKCAKPLLKSIVFESDIAGPKKGQVDFSVLETFPHLNHLDMGCIDWFSPENFKTLKNIIIKNPSITPLGFNILKTQVPYFYDSPEMLDAKTEIYEMHGACQKALFLEQKQPPRFCKKETEEGK
jgi:hypothetical protein